MLLPPTCLSFGLSVSPVCLSVSQTSMDDSGHKGNTRQLLNSRVLGVPLTLLSHNLIYDSSLRLLVRVKVIPKSFGTCLNSTYCYCFKLMR